MSIAEKLTKVAENQQKVFEAGKKSEYDFFWDGLQDKGKRRMYSSTFQGWTDEMFYPKYDLVFGTQSTGQFHFAKIKDLSRRLEECDVTMRFATNSLQSFFNQCTSTSCPTLDFSHVTGNNTVSMQYTFQAASNLRRIHLKNARLAYYQNPFSGCNSLEEIVLENVVFTATSVSGLSLADSTKLTKESLLAVINALQQTTNTVTFTFGTTNLAKLSDAEIAIATQKGWTVA